MHADHGAPLLTALLKAFNSLSKRLQHNGVSEHVQIWYVLHVRIRFLVPAGSMIRLDTEPEPQTDSLTS